MPSGLIKGGASLERLSGLCSQVTPQVDRIPGRRSCFLTLGEGNERETEHERVWTGFLGFSEVDVLERWALARD